MKHDTLFIKCPLDLTSQFMPELQKEFYIISAEGRTIYSFLTEDCGLSDEYISAKVKTIFIDGGPVDDIFNTKIKTGGVCALSGAMPGIVGAMMRIGSPYAAMRESITIKPDETAESEKEIIFGLKIFNAILSDMGLEFLRRGILLEKKRIFELFAKYGRKIFSSSSAIFLNNFLLEKHELKCYCEDKISDLVLFKIEIENEN